MIYPTKPVEADKVQPVSPYKDLARLMVEIVKRGERITATDQGDGQGIYFSAFEQTVSWKELGEKWLWLWASRLASPYPSRF